jgi:hypothetical protein
VTMTGAAYINVYNNHTSSYNGGIYNLAGALWDIQTNAIIYSEELGDEFFDNVGTVSKSKGVDTASIYVPFTNSGTADVLAGILSFYGSFVSAAGTLDFGASSLGSVGQIDVSGNVALNGTASITWLDGFVPAIGNTFHLINYASHTGTFSSISLASGFVGQGNYNNTFFSVSVTGTGPQTNTPVLSIERESPTTVAVVWPTSPSGFDLQTRTNLALGTWSNVVSGIVTVGTNYVLTNTVNGKGAYFRLEAP